MNINIEHDRHEPKQYRILLKYLLLTEYLTNGMCSILSSSSRYRSLYISATCHAKNLQIDKKNFWFFYMARYYTITFIVRASIHYLSIVHLISKLILSCFLSRASIIYLNECEEFEESIYLIIDNKVTKIIIERFDLQKYFHFFFIFCTIN